MMYCASCGHQLQEYPVPYDFEHTHYDAPQPSYKQPYQQPYQHPHPHYPAHAGHHYHSRGWFIGGTIGSFITAISAILLGVLFLMYVISYGEFEGAWLPFFVIALLLFTVGALMKAMGCYGFYRVYGSHFGILAMVFGIIGTVLFLALALVSINHYESSYNYYSYSYYWLGVEVWIGMIFAGIMFILSGIAFIMVKDYTGVKGATISTGIIQIVAGGMLIGLLGYVGAAWFLLACAEFISGIVFAKANQHSPYQYPGQESYHRARQPPWM